MIVYQTIGNIARIDIDNIFVSINTKLLIDRKKSECNTEHQRSMRIQ